MTTFYFVRHGQTEWNLEKRFQGAHGDSPLLQTSYDDMKKVAGFLSDKQISRVYASPLKRARVTAAEIQKELPGNPELSLHSNIIEVGLGDWEGELKADVMKNYPEAYDTYRNHLEKFEGQGFHGEGYTKAVARFQRFINEVAENHPNDAILMVAHGLILTFGMSSLLGVPREEIRSLGGLSNTSTTTIEKKPGEDFRLIKWNETDYLNKEQDASTTI
ncbi:histidine phosphatase family protein [Fructobacillus sp. M2-14]|uniref:Histidine phosphatase family protein n=1 Tax=Fructobacillus broussonetiae TaxID=2713173 RepID=A0ABS5QZU1_9LACO|nr:histidine phosphatase family protein [Fructobacillus broussonetiae]MBS9338482.1 histidine phosphatase family protein [Fructobacillus broussonetiae]